MGGSKSPRSKLPAESLLGILDTWSPVRYHLHRFLRFVPDQAPGDSTLGTWTRGSPRYNFYRFAPVFVPGNQGPSSRSNTGYVAGPKFDQSMNDIGLLSFGSVSSS